MEKPQIQIINSRVYNNSIRLWLGREDYLSHEELTLYRDKLEKLWREEGEVMEGLIIDSLGWPWRQKKIECFVTGTRASFSSPLTVGYRKNITLAFNLLVHELIHCYISQNIPELRKKMGNFYAKFPSEGQIVKNHIAVHAIHEYVYRKSDRVDQLEADIEKCQSSLDYARSWEIVNNIGYEKVLKEISA